MRKRVGLFLLLLVGCDRTTPAAPTATPTAAPSEARPTVSTMTDASSACGDVVGAWSSTVDGLRARLVTSGSKPDRSALRIVLELENVDTKPLEIHWNGSLPFGFATFRLDDAAGNDVEPDWRFGGNEHGGKIRVTLLPGKVATYAIHDGPFVMMLGKRALRIGAFWGRELPSDGSRKFLRGKVTGAPEIADAIAYGGNSPAPPSTPRARVWVGSLELPAVCIQ